MTALVSTRRRAALLGAGALVALAAAGAAGQAATAAKKPSCLRGGATLEQRSGSVRVVRLKVAEQSRYETRREYVLACWAPTGRRTVVAREIDNGLDNRARTHVEIVDGRYVGVLVHNQGGVSEALQARTYDARTRKLLHTSKACDEIARGDLSGVDDVAFLPGGGLAISCDRLLLYRKPGAAAETLEPAGTPVRQIAVSRYTHGYGARLFWSVVPFDGAESTKSLVL